MNCKDNCLHYEVCAQFSKADGANHEYYDFSNQAEKCECFKDCHRGINDERLTPTADVVPVVRCKDCRLATEDTMIDGWYYDYTATLDLIKRQKAEIDSAKAKIEICAEVIERQDAEIKRVKECPKCVYEYDGEITEYCVQGPCSNFKTVEQIKAEAYKEFAEKIKLSIKANVVETLCNDVRGVYKAEYVLDDIDNLLKEMVGEKE